MRWTIIAAVLVAAPVLAQQPGGELIQNGVGHRVIPRPVPVDQQALDNLRLPEGFKVTVFADGLEAPRMLAVGDDGTVYVTRRRPGDVLALRDANADGVVDEAVPVVEGMPGVHGIALRGGSMYLCTNEALFAAPIENGKVGEPRLLLDGLPPGGRHPNRTIAFGPDGMLYLSVGSTCNCCVEADEESAAILRVDPADWSRTVFARGLRNTIGFGWHPATGQMWGLDHGTDGLGDDVPPEELNRIEEGRHYGWPFVWGDGETIPPEAIPEGSNAVMLARRAVPPVLAHTAHAAPLQMAFYTGDRFPAEYRNDAFAAMHGSWNRETPSGYEVVRIRFDRDGEPQSIEPFLTGFLLDGPTMFGRPCGIAVARDGSLLVGDDLNGVIYRISHAEADAAAPAEPAPPPAAATVPLTLRSGAFESGERIPIRNTAYGDDRSPPLAWDAVPGAKSYAIIMDDPDVRGPNPYVHWVVFNIPGTTTALPEGMPKDERPAEPAGAVQGINSRRSIGYFGPRTPPGGPHRYHFRLYALDAALDLPAGATRQALLDAMQGHILAQAELVGTFQKPE